MDDAQTFHDRAYATAGFDSQRRYPNEELLRFMGRNFFPIPRGRERKNVSMLEVGCGSGANLWMIAREGFDAHGIDFSPGAIALCRQMLDHWQTTATLSVADMTALPQESGQFDAVLDVFSAYCLDERGFDRFLSEVARVLKPGGRLFSYTPSKASDTFRAPGASTRIDASTLAGIRREASPYFGIDHPFRFISADELDAALRAHGLTVTHSERVSRTYGKGSEYFEWIVIEAQKV